MRSPSSKLIFLVAVAVAALVAWAPAAFADVVGTRGTEIISPPNGAFPADGPSDGTGPSSGLLPTGILPYLLDGSRAGSGPFGLPNDPAPFSTTPRPMDNLEFSQDNRVIRYATYDSIATNLVAGKPGDGHHHIYLFKRNLNGSSTSEILSGTLVRVDPNAGGDSFKPSLDGQTKTGNGAIASHCVAFQSTSKLTKDDGSTSSSIYLYDIDKGTFQLISGGAQDARDAVVDGTCNNITFESGGRVWLYWGDTGALVPVAKGFNPDQQTDGKGVAYDRDGQVYYRSYKTFSLQRANGQHFNAMIMGPEILVSNSATDPENGANGHSSMPSVNDNGAYVAFESTATDLCASVDGTTDQRCQGVSKDRNGDHADVFRRTLATDAPTGRSEREKVHGKVPVKKRLKHGSKIVYVNKVFPVGNEMEMVSYDGVEDFQSDGDSTQVKLSGAGEQACFRSFGALTHDHKFQPDGHTGPFSEIYFWNSPRDRLKNGLPQSRFTGESKAGTTSDTEFVHADRTAAFNWSCAISNRGNLIGWTSDEEGQSGELNGRLIPDMFIRFMGASDEGLGGIGS